MTESKICPACNEQVPILAVRCKFCGIRLAPPKGAGSADSPSSSSTEASGSTESMPPPPPPLASTPPPPPRVSEPPPPPRVSEPPPPPPRVSEPPPPPPRASNPPPPPPRTSEPPPPPPRTSEPPPPPPKSSVPSPPQPGGFKKTMMMGSFQAPASKDAIPRPSRSTLPPPPVNGAPIEEELPELEPDEGNTGVEDIVSLATGGMRDSTQEMLSDVSEEIEVGMAEEYGVSPIKEGEPAEPAPPQTSSPPPPPQRSSSPPPHVSPPPSVEMDDLDDAETALYSQVSGIRRPLFGRATLTSFRERGLPDGVIRFMNTLKVMHAIAAAAVFVFVVILIAAFSGEEAPEASDVVAKKAPTEKAESKPESKKPTENKAKAEPEKDKKPTKEEAPQKEADKPSVPDSPGGCKPFSRYPKFAWSSHIGSLVNAAGKQGICQLFGSSASSAVTALKDSPQYGPTGYDLLPSGSVLEIFPGGKKDRRAPTIEMLFIDEKLFEIRMNYGATAGKKVKNSLFEDTLGKPVKKGTDSRGRKFMRYEDGDLIIIQSRKRDKYRRVFREIVFMSKAIRDANKEKVEQRAKAEAAFARGMDAFFQYKSNKAVESFAEARRIISGFGMAYVFEGITLIRQEKFVDADSLATKALEVSRDKRAHAEAKGIKAVAALYHRKVEDATAMFRSASELDATNSDFANSVSELVTKKYSPARVAKTAARMSCREKKNKKLRKKKAAGWTTEGLLARGNFPNTATYEKALKRVKRKRAFKKEYKRWKDWECR
ncbi:MAG: hypothetical protein GY847_16980 [Proteobacteria bacterium]|nr:hypothetical protein [Pseudomonadota bacterium]